MECYPWKVDALRRDDIEEARRTPPEEKARQVGEMFAMGIELKRAGLRLRHPGASDDELEAMIDEWLASDA